MRFTVVCYRPDGDDYCRGCLMSSSSSGFELYVEETVGGAGLRIAEKEFADRDPNRDRAVCSWEVILLIDGGEDHNDDSAAKEARARVEVAAKAHLQRMIDERTALELAEKQRSDALKAEAAKQRREAKEQRERDEYERLKVKFER